ncbi:MAG: TonB-dependent receptor [Thermoanaerobaculales bacterium]|jgi:iron complex outermembrane receptor protein|nr:TonB-dependent receptor [Thermoanaerobaculales bacterium]
MIGRYHHLIILAVLLPGALLLCSTAEATAELSFKVQGGDPSQAVSVEVQAPDGSVESFQVPGGSLVVQPDGQPGTYRVTFSTGGETASADVPVPAHGQVIVTFRPDELQQKITIDEPGPIENIMVTARRVEEPLQQSPVAITALTTSQLEDQHITNIQELALATPNLWMEKNTSSSSGARAAIRGIGEDESMFTSDTPVGIYIDDVYIPRQLGAQFDLYETERLEVLRGPQGTLYGRNTSAGAIKLISKQPHSEFALNLEAALGNFDRMDFRGMVNVPVADWFSFQLAAMTRSHDGFDENLYDGNDVNDQDIWGTRLSLRFMPSDSVDILVVGDVLKESSTPGFPLGFVPQAPFINGFGVGQWSFEHQLDGDTDPHTLLSDLEPPYLNDLDQSGIYATIDWQVSEEMSFKSVSAWRELSSEFFVDGDGQVGNQFLPGIIPEFLPLFHIFQDQTQDQISQELQLLGTIGTKIDYVGGLYYFTESNQQITENVVLSLPGLNRYTDSSLDTDSYAGFASFDFHLLDNLTLTAGGRWTEDTKDFDITVFNPDGSQMIACVGPGGEIIDSQAPCGPDAPPGSVDTPVEKHLDDSWSRFTPRLALAWNAADNILAYVDLSTGFKSGAFDGRANEGSTVLPLEPIPPEDISSFEIGMKGDFFHNTWRLNIAAFLNQYDDLQGTGTDPDGNFLRFSLGDVETSGAEIETIVVPIDGLQLTGNLALLDTKFTEQNFNQAVDCAPYGTGDIDLELKYSPKTSYRIGALYTTPNKVAGGYFSIGANYSYKAKHFLGFCNAGAQTQPAYDVVDGIIAYDTANGHWRFELAGKNITDEEYMIGVFAIPGLRIVSGYIAPPMTYTFTAKLRF